MSEIEIIRYSRIKGLNLFYNNVIYRSPHQHKDLEILLVLDQCMQINSAASVLTVHKGDLVLLNPGVTHELTSKDGCLFLCLHMDPAMYPGCSGLVFDTVDAGPYLSKEDREGISAVLADIMEHYLRQQPDYELYCFSKAGLLLHKIMNKVPHRILSAREAMESSRRSELIRKLLKYVDENYTGKVRLSDFASAEGLSMHYLSHVISASLNQSFQEYVSSVRLNEAVRLIRDEDLKLTDICYQTGFSDYRYFSQAFKKRFEMTPDEYRGSAAAKDHRDWSTHSSHSSERFYTLEESLAITEELSQNANLSNKPSVCTRNENA